MRVAVVIGTRPETIKMSPVISECIKRGVPCTVIHTGQHFDSGMRDSLFIELGLPMPDTMLESGRGGSRNRLGGMTRDVMMAVEQVRPDLLMVHGDTLSTVAGILAGSSLGILTAHVEAGLRSGDTSTSEEVNRIIADNIADYLFAPTVAGVENLGSEGIGGSVCMPGNTIADVMGKFAGSVELPSCEPFRGLSPRGFILLTVHRAENVDDAGRFSGIMEALAGIAARHPGLPVVFPVHPRTVRRLERLGPGLPSGMTATKSLGFRDFLGLAKNALMVLTDSGGVQEEACLLRVPCVTLRDRTERPETLENGMNTLAGTDPVRICESFERVIEDPPTRWTNPYGDGRTAERIMDRVIREIST